MNDWKLNETYETHIPDMDYSYVCVVYLCMITFLFVFWYSESASGCNVFRLQRVN